MSSELEEAQWRYRRDLLPDGDPLVAALEEFADRERTHTIQSVRRIDPVTGKPGPVEDLTVANGTCTARPSPRTKPRAGPHSPGQQQPCPWYATSGFVDAHAHVSSLADLVGLLVHGVTACRQLWGEPAHLLADGARRARHTVLPRLWTTAGVVDGPSTRLPEVVTVVNDERAVRRVIEDAVAFGFDGVKVYDDVEPAVLDELFRAATRANVPVVGHAPQRVPFATVARGMRTSEHLYGVVPNVFRLPADRRWPVLADALAGTGVATRAASLGEALAGSGPTRHLICPTLVCWRARSGERARTRPSRAALAAATPNRRRAWQHAAREALRLDPSEVRSRSGSVDRLGELVARTENVAGWPGGYGLRQPVRTGRAVLPQGACRTGAGRPWVSCPAAGGDGQRVPGDGTAVVRDSGRRALVLAGSGPLPPAAGRARGWPCPAGRGADRRCPSGRGGSGPAVGPAPCRFGP